MNNMETTAIRVALVDDHDMFRKGLAALLHKSTDVSVVGEWASSGEAIGQLPSARPAIVLLDFDLGADGAFRFLDGARSLQFDGRVLILTAGVSEAEAIQLVQAGVAGILHKHNSPEVLCDVIRKVAAGEVWLEKNYLRPLFRTVEQTQASSGAKLTDREKRILRLVFQGFGNKEIGARLDLSEGAIKAALRQLFQKLGVHTRAQMVKVALEDYGDQL
jgi:two-component system, NarL family, nitrate/nitrite response regulator NarL